LYRISVFNSLVHPREAEYLYQKFRSLSGHDDGLSATDLLAFDADLKYSDIYVTFRAVVPYFMNAFSDPDTKRIPFHVFVNYLVISVKGSEEDKAELVTLMVNPLKPTIQRSDFLQFVNRVTRVCKLDDSDNKDMKEWTTEIFRERETTLEAPEDHALTNFDVNIDDVRDSKVNIPDLPSEYIKDFRSRHPDQSRIETKEKPKSGREKSLDKSYKRTTRGSKIDLHAKPMFDDESGQTLEEKAEKFKEDFKEKALDLKYELREKAQEIKKDWEDIKESLQRKLKFKPTKPEEVPRSDARLEKTSTVLSLSHDNRSPNKNSPQVTTDAVVKVLPVDELKEVPGTNIVQPNLEHDEVISEHIQEPKTKTPEKTESNMEKKEEVDDDHDESDGKGEHKLVKLLNQHKDWLHQGINEMKGIRDVSRAELTDHGQFFKPYYSCFGLFEKTAKFVTELHHLRLWDMANVRYNLGIPVISGTIRGDYSGFAKIESGFISIYVGKKNEIECNNAEPNLVLNLREAIVKDRKYNRHLLSAAHSRKHISLSDEDESEIFMTINRSDYHFVIDDDSHDKWIWAIRLNSGFHFQKFDSFAPIRRHVACRFLHCGEQYFDELYNCLMSAKSQIFICGWMLSPKYFLARNPNKYNLDDILVEKAKSGVKVYLLLWKDPGMIIDNGSSECEIHFNSFREPNLQVIRDPPAFGLVIWSHHQKIGAIDQDVAFVGGIDLAYNRYEIPGEYPLFDVDGDFFPGMDYVNPLIRQINVGDYRQSLYNRVREPRMPWNDIHCKIVGGSARDVSINFIERWNFAVLASKSDFRTMKTFIVPKTTTFIQSNSEPYPNCKVQVLRSVSSWSFGLDIAETSIQNAYIALIEKAKHFIYIENQFFISSASKNQIYPQNKILMALLNKLRIAIKKKEDFRVIVMIPIQTASLISDTTTQLIMYWEYHTIYRGENSLFGILEKEFPKVDIGKYIFFTSMRTWQNVPNSPESVVTEIIYVHSKCMIVDDRYVIIGSANINDRSLSEGRDSEIAILIEDTEKIESKMGGEVFTARKFAHYLRINLWKKYIRTDDSFIDPIAYFDRWVEIAEHNGKIFDHVFIKTHSNIKTLHEIKYLSEYNENIKPRDLEKLKELIGYLVPFPRDFLIDMPKPKSITLNELKENLYYM
jgi:phosphatidylserine/phosphatidylglycerophosphate/cardiolipin synthase-like enzyme